MNALRLCVILAISFFILGCECRADKLQVEVARLMDTRKAAMERVDLDAYQKLIAPDYKDEMGDRASLMALMQKTLQGVTKVQVNIVNRKIKIDDQDDIATVTQNYRVVMYSSQDEFRYNGTERISVAKRDGVWLITGGLRGREVSE